MKSKTKFKKINSNLIFLIIILIALLGIISNPELSLQSATSGALMWFYIIVPSLFPFFIISEILIRLGFVDFIGNLLQPIMRPLFNVSGQGAFPLALSIISGYPVGSKLTSRLREEKIITKEEGDRLICFTSTSGPLFMLGAVSIGMLKDPGLSILIILPHYLSIILLGLIFKYYNSKKKSKLSNVKSRSIFEEISQGYNELIKTKKSIGSLITMSIKASMDTIFLIGGLLIFYSVLVEVIFSFNIIHNILKTFANYLSIDEQVIKGTIAGIFEMTTGCKNIANTNLSIINKVLIINFLIGWGGLSVHSQAISFINNTDINSKIYIFSKLLHGVFSTTFTYIIYLLKFKNYIQPAFFDGIFQYNNYTLHNWLYLIFSSLEIAIILIIFLLILSLFINRLFRN